MIIWINGPYGAGGAGMDGGKTMRILCYGDSNTYGYDPRSWLGDRYPAQERWVDILAQKTGWELLNRGQNGRQIPRRAGELEQAARTIRANGPLDGVFIMLGTNDLLQGNSPQAVREDMEAFVNCVSPLCGRVLLIAPPAMERGEWVTSDSLVENSRRLAGEYQALAEKLGISFANGCRWGVEMAHDGVHFTGEGHRAFAGGVLEAWKEAAECHGI